LKSRIEHSCASSNGSCKSDPINRAFFGKKDQHREGSCAKAVLKSRIEHSCATNSNGLIHICRDWNESCHMWISLDSHMNESCHMWMSLGKYEWATSHLYEVCRRWTFVRVCNCHSRVVTHCHDSSMDILVTMNTSMTRTADCRQSGTESWDDFVKKINELEFCP